MILEMSLLRSMSHANLGNVTSEVNAMGIATSEVMLHGKCHVLRQMSHAMGNVTFCGKCHMLWEISFNPSLYFDQNMA